MRALITGATGFLGSHLTRKLSSDGHEVHVIVRPNSNLEALDKLGTAIKCHVIDAATAPIGIIDAARPEVVFHLATHFVAQHTSDDVAKLVDSNILFPCQLVDAMARRGARRLVNCSSAWQHYEGADYDPVCLYAATKEAFIKVLQYYIAAEQFSVVNLTLTDTYGPNDRRAKLFAALYRSVAKNESLAFSPGHQLLDLVYVDDVVDAFGAAANRLIQNETSRLEDFAIRSGEAISLRELIAKFAAVTGLSPKIDWGARPYRLREMMNPWEGGRPLPGWQPSIGIEEGIRRMHESHVCNSQN